MRYLAIDIGARRTGFALGERELAFVQPLKVVEHANEAEMIVAVEQMTAEHGPDALVIGLPLGISRTGLYGADPSQELSSSHCRPAGVS